MRLAPVCEYLNYYCYITNDYQTIQEKIQAGGGWGQTFLKQTLKFLGFSLYLWKFQKQNKAFLFRLTPSFFCARPFDQTLWSSFIYLFYLHTILRPRILFFKKNINKIGFFRFFEGTVKYFWYNDFYQPTTGVIYAWHKVDVIDKIEKR